MKAISTTIVAVAALSIVLLLIVNADGHITPTFERVDESLQKAGGGETLLRRVARQAPPVDETDEDQRAMDADPDPNGGRDPEEEDQPGPNQGPDDADGPSEDQRAMDADPDPNGGRDPEDADQPDPNQGPDYADGATNVDEDQRAMDADPDPNGGRDYSDGATSV